MTPLRGGPIAVVTGVVEIALAGALAFGLWDVVGGVVNGNPRAGQFGIVLAAASGALLAGVLLAARRFSRRPPRS